MKRYHFISGLPRSGSTLLSALLSQNPNFSAGISTPLARFVRSIITETHAAPGYPVQCPPEKQVKLIQALVETFHADKPGEVHFDTNRGWTALVDVLANTHPDAKIICCVRSITDILNSFERLFRENPFSQSKLYAPVEAETVFTRAEAMLAPGHTLRFAYDSLREAIVGYNSNKLFLVEYDQLVAEPATVMKALYAFIKEPLFEHDFENLDTSFAEFDEAAGIPGLHQVRPVIAPIHRRLLLPPEIIAKFSNLEAWR